MVRPTLTCQTEATLVPTNKHNTAIGGFAAAMAIQRRDCASAAGTGSFLSAHKNILPDGSVNSPVGIDNLGDAEIRRDRHQGDRFILTHVMDGHEKAAEFSKGIAHRLVEARMVRHIGLGVWT